MKSRYKNSLVNLFAARWYDRVIGDGAMSKSEKEASKLRILHYDARGQVEALTKELICFDSIISQGFPTVKAKRKEKVLLIESMLEDATKFLKLVSSLSDLTENWVHKKEVVDPIDIEISVPEANATEDIIVNDEETDDESPVNEESLDDEMMEDIIEDEDEDEIVSPHSSPLEDEETEDSSEEEDEVASTPSKNDEAYVPSYDYARLGNGDLIYELYIPGADSESIEVTKDALNSRILHINGNIIRRSLFKIRFDHTTPVLPKDVDINQATMIYTRDGTLRLKFPMIRAKKRARCDRTRRCLPRQYIRGPFDFNPYRSQRPTLAGGFGRHFFF
jgi:hypothetical protein